MYSTLDLTKNILNDNTKKIHEKEYFHLYHEFYLISKVLSQNIQYIENINKLKSELLLLEQQLKQQEEGREYLIQNINFEVVKKIQDILLQIDKSQNQKKENSLNHTEYIKCDLEAVLEVLKNYIASSELNSNNIPLKKKSVELSDLVTDLERSSKKQLITKNILIRSIVSPYIPRIYIDVEKVKLALLNLLYHICNHSHSESELDIVCYKSMNNIVIELKNDTYNITRKDLDRLREHLYIKDKSQYIYKENMIEKDLLVAINILDLHNAKTDIRSNETIGVMIRVSFDIDEVRK